MSLAAQAWLALMVLFVIAEIVSPRWLFLPFGLGSAAAGVVEHLTPGSQWQWVAFLGLSSVVLVVAQRIRQARGTNRRS